MALHVVSVDDGSPAWRLGIEAGCTLLAVDDHPLHDALDYQFYTTPPRFSLQICRNGEPCTLAVEKASMNRSAAILKLISATKSTAVPTTACSALSISSPGYAGALVFQG